MVSSNETVVLGTIPDIVYKCATIDRIAAIFDSENVMYSFEKVKDEMDLLAAGLLSTGLKPQDRVLICGSNMAHFFLCSLACARAELIFSLCNPNFPNADQLQYVLNKGQFRAIICFPASREAEFLNSLLNSIAPEMRHSGKGRICSKALPELTHVIMAEEDHKHAGTYTLSEIYGRSNRERVCKLPSFDGWDTHKLAALQFTAGTSARPKLVGLSHYQLLNGCRIAAKALEFNEKSCICCALPLSRMPIYTLMALTPFVTNSRVVFPSPSPLPKYLFESVKKYQCSHLLSNAVALRLILRIASSQNIQMPSVESVVLLGERVTKDAIEHITKQFENVKKITSGYLLTETASIPVMTSDKKGMIRSIGKPIQGFSVEVRSAAPVDKFNGSKFGELYVSPAEGSKFCGYEAPYEESADWIATGDLVAIDDTGEIELFCNKEDLTLDSAGRVVEHWLIEKMICTYDQVKGAQVVSLDKKLPLIAFIVLKSTSANQQTVINDIAALCKNNKLPVPGKFAFVSDFPRLNTKIQKYRMREMARKDEVTMISG